MMYPNVRVQLSGQDGNAFNIIALVSRGLRDAGLREEAKQFSNEAMDCESYDALLRLTMKWVNVS